MHRIAVRPALAAGFLALVTSCASTDAGTGAEARTPASGSPDGSVSPVMPMSDERGDGPSAAARMICSQDIRKGISASLGAPVAAGSATWANLVYTCRYQLAAGTLVLSVKDSPDVSAGLSYFTHARTRTPTAQPLRGLLDLGLPSYETRSGTAVFLKDGKTLTVDASHLPMRMGPDPHSRTDVAYAIAAAVVACWSE